MRYQAHADDRHFLIYSKVVKVSGVGLLALWKEKKVGSSCNLSSPRLIQISVYRKSPDRRSGFGAVLYLIMRMPLLVRSDTSSLFTYTRLGLEDTSRIPSCRTPYILVLLSSFSILP